MDEINERNVLQVLEEVSKSPNCCQFFIITPKLLHNIKYPINCRVHTIHSIPTAMTFPFKLNDTYKCFDDWKKAQEESDEEN